MAVTTTLETHQTEFHVNYHHIHTGSCTFVSHVEPSRSPVCITFVKL